MNETTLPPKEAFYSNVNLENISDVDYAHTQKVWEGFEIKHCGEYHDLYVQSNSLLLADVFENFRNMCLEIYELDPVYFVSAPRLAWQACIKKNRSKIRINNRIWYAIVDWKGFGGRICQATYRYAKANNKYLENYYKNNESSHLKYLDANSLYG